MNEPRLHANVFEGSIFKESEKGLVAALKNRFNNQKANVLGIQSHNILTISDIEKIFDSEFINVANAE